MTKTKLAKTDHERPASNGAVEVVDSAAQFVKIEKNLTALGFFTPTNKDLKTTGVKTVRFVRINEAQQAVETSVRIVPGVGYGLPGTADLDKYLALQSIINDIHKREGIVTNPIKFTSSELLALLGKYKDSGKNYRAVEEWLDRMYATTIESKGVVYYAKQNRFGKERNRVFDRAVSAGRELDDGVIADCNYVWLSQWQLENINNNYLIPVDFSTYRELRNPVAKILVPLLQIWLYATRTEKVFEKRYDALCQILGLKQYPNISLIKQKISPAFNELAKHDYLAKWDIVKERNGGYKVLLHHGTKFHRDLALNSSKRDSNVPQLQPAANAEDQQLDESLVRHLVERSIKDSEARRLLSGCAPGQPVEDQIEWFDHLMATDKSGKYTNPAGFLFYFIANNLTVPSWFETSSKLRARDAQAREETKGREAEWAALEEVESIALLEVQKGSRSNGEEAQPPVESAQTRYQQEMAYSTFLQQESSRHFKEVMTDEQRTALVEETRKEMERDLPQIVKWKAETKEQILWSLIEKKLRAVAPLPTFEEFFSHQIHASSGANKKGISKRAGG